MTGTVLLTGFAPFGGRPVNASALAVAEVARRWAGAELVTATLPVSFARAVPELLGLVGTLRPVLVLCVGEAAGRARVEVERVAVNILDARQPDEDGQTPIEQPVLAGGPVGYLATLPVGAAVDAARESGAPADSSLSAGGFVCNATFYGLLHATADLPATRCGFVHVPLTPDEAAPDGPSLATPVVARALAAILRASL